MMGFKLFKGSSEKALAVLLAGSLLLGLGCEKKRALEFLQGTGENLYAIQEYKDITFKVKTGEKVFRGQTSQADQLEVLEGFTAINNLDAVAFRIDEGLFSGIDLSTYNFYGRENYEYTLKYSFTDDYVILSKIADKKDIPSQELTYAKSLGGDQYEVPIMGLPTNLYTVEKVRDDRGKDTRRVNTYSKDYLKDATHFKISEESVKYFDAPKKQDLLFADYFNPNDEWFYTKTLVGRAIDSYSILGGTEASLKIKFARTNNSVLGVDLNIAKEQEILDPTKTITALEIPVEWVDFRTETAGSDANLKEEKLGDNESASRFWQERSYALVDFNNADRLSKTYTADNKLEKLEIGNDYLSFTIYESSTGNTYKYSLVKANGRVQGQQMYADDTKLFHVFAASRTVIKGALYSQEPDYNKLVYANRFYPKNGEIVFNITKNTPNEPEFIEAIQNSVDAWDVAFQKAGTSIRVRLDDKRVELGDVRYNQIVFYGYEIDSSLSSGGTLLGFGPSVQDTRTGETFSAATHIYLRAYREGVIRNVRNFIRNELGLYDDKKIAGVKAFRDSDNAVEAGSFVSSSVPSLGGAASVYNYFANNPSLFDRAPEAREDVLRKTAGSFDPEALKAYDSSRLNISAQAAASANGPRCEHANVAASANSWKNVRETCVANNGPLADYLERLLAANASDPRVLNVEGEEEAILACAQPLMKDLLTSTLIHEIGHNLGLGHNFAASSDGPNFAKDDDGSVAYPASSVMDYPDRDFDVYSKAGPYDVAAVRYLYGNKVETKSGEVIDIPQGLSIFQAARAKGVELKPYEMCTDILNANNLPFFNPLCLKWDVGSKPQDFVRWAISQIHADIIQNGYIYNNKSFDGASRSISYFSNFRQIHEYFRFLIAKRGGAFLEYAKTEAALDELVKTSKDKTIADYYEATKLIFEFARELLNLPSRVCLLSTAADPEAATPFEFQVLRNTIFEANQVTVQNCEEAKPYLPGLFRLEDLQVSDRGLDIMPLELDLDPTSASDKLKRGFAFGIKDSDLYPSYSSGTMGFKLAAIAMLTNRTPTLQSAANIGLRVNFLDMPWYRSLLVEDSLIKTLYGVEGASIDPRFAGAVIPHFQEYAGINGLTLSLLFAGSNQISSSAYSEAQSFTPNKELNVSNLLRFARELSETTAYFKNSKKQIVYASSGHANLLLEKLANLAQVEIMLALKDKLDTEPFQNMLSAQMVAQSNVEGDNREKLLRASFSFFEAFGLHLQPTQINKLAASLQVYLTANPLAAETELSTTAAGVAVELKTFVSDTLAKEELKPIVDLYSTDPLNFRAQKKTIETFLETF